MEQAVPWAGLALIEPICPEAGNGRPPYLLETMLRIHLLPNWPSAIPQLRKRCTRSPPLHRFARLSLTQGNIPEDRHLLEQHGLAAGISAVIERAIAAARYHCWCLHHPCTKLDQ
ncbi:transposase [Pseudomonas sp. BDPW]|nr:transposase [Pseudomonas sp. BDPW]